MPPGVFSSYGKMDFCHVCDMTGRSAPGTNYKLKCPAFTVECNDLPHFKETVGMSVPVKELT